MKKPTLEEQKDLTNEEWSELTGKSLKDLSTFKPVTIEEALRKLGKSLPTQKQLDKTFSSFKDTMSKFYNKKL